MILSNILRRRLSGGLLCCCVLVVAYLFQALFPGMYVDAFSSSFILSMWLVIFVGALLWTLREGKDKIPFEVADWQCIAAFLLLVSDQIYVIMPKEIHQAIAPALSTYTIPTLVVGGLILTGLIKLSSSLFYLLQSERRKAILQTQRLQEILAIPPLQQKNIALLRKLIENKSIYQFTATEYLSLVEECRLIDPDLFIWLRNQNIQLPARDIVLCVLIRMCKTKEEILSILAINDGTYRTMKSRIRKRLSLGDNDLETFMQNLN